MRKRSRQSGRSGADSVAFSAVFYQGYDERADLAMKPLSNAAGSLDCRSG
jgi:hypothetical protein